MVDDNKTVWCGNLSDRVTEELLYELFLQLAPLERVRIPTDKEGRKSNYGFITVKHDCSVDYVVEMLNGTNLFNKKMHVRRSSRNQSLQQQQQQQQLRQFSHQQQQQLQQQHQMNPQAFINDLLSMGQMLQMGSGLYSNNGLGPQMQPNLDYRRDQQYSPGEHNNRRRDRDNSRPYNRNYGGRNDSGKYRGDYNRNHHRDRNRRR